ncbi:Lrp/AsnC family transcriptional regulator [Sphingobium sp.]|uniref:Lrp/AsnC family transcriptional regulator n=1 Tax=Sphingobium sp. TaxID=1912891 RepID=UPI002C6DD8F1|nr:Lrp/AsnC family transcriptional regulator [Sphingobium sp.]HUD93067.1 Lrp/AsnC family transcriptional regulator [Sphingobium sp.]
MSETFAFDEMDRKIVEQLRLNGRATNQQIAESLNLIASTVSTRIRRMEDAGMLRVVAVSDFAVHGHHVLIHLAVEVCGRPALDVAEELAVFPQVFAAHLVTGRYEISLLLTLRDMDELSPLITDSLSKVPGIRSMTPAIGLDIVKYGLDTAPIDSRRLV